MSHLKQTKVGVGLLARGIFCSFVFQNCGSDVQFKSAADVATPMKQLGNGQPGNANIATLTPLATPVPPAQISEFVCKSVKALQLPPEGQALQIPDRDANGTCCGIKLMSGIVNGDSNLTKTFDTEVLVNNHRRRNGDNAVPTVPFLMGQANFAFTLRGVRHMKLSGALDQVTNIIVDNFVLVGFGEQAPSLNANNYAAYGTADAVIPGSDSIKLDGSLIQLKPFAGAGTATIGLLDISQAVSPNIAYQLDVRAEDCGGARELSDIYLIFQ